MRVACRWPGGMTLAVTRRGVPPMTVKLNGPAKASSVLPQATNMRDLPSRHAATGMHKKVVDMVKVMKDSSSDAFDVHHYGVTDVPGDFWKEWFKQNSTFDVVTHKMVFAL